VRAAATQGWDPTAYGDISASGYVFSTSGDGGVVRTFPDGRTEQVFERVCPDGSRGFAWVDTSITVQDVIDDAVDRARRAVPAPELEMSPPPDAGGVVNLGMWLAVREQAPVTVRAEAGLLWAEATVRLSSTRWDMGNGDVVDCVGTGVPITDMSTVEEGPCGYTYRASSPEVDPFAVTVTARWTVTYRSSSGAGSSGSMDRSSTVVYDVDEIQTIGIAN
jgi:hypothetical protein